MIIENTPASQMDIFKFVSQYYTVIGQNPMDTIFLDITSSGEGRGNLYSSSDLEWHMDGGYMQNPVHITGLYAVDVSDDGQFVASSSSNADGENFRMLKIWKFPGLEGH